MSDHGDVYLVPNDDQLNDDRPKRSINSLPNFPTFQMIKVIYVYFVQVMHQHLVLYTYNVQQAAQSSFFALYELVNLNFF